MEIAVIGAGLAGLAAARSLHTAGHRVVVWEKSRGVGGRTATRRGPDGMRFDHGAPFFHELAGVEGQAKDDLAGLAGLARYELRLPGGRAQTETVGDGAASATAKTLAAGLDVRPGVRVGRVTATGPGAAEPADAGPVAGETGGEWTLADEHGQLLGRYGAVIVTAPAPQAATLLAEPAPELAARAASVGFDACWSVMAAWAEPLGLPFTAAREAGGLAWAIAEAPKPGRGPGERWVLQATTALTNEHLEAEPGAVAELLLGRFSAVAGRPLPAPIHVAAHRWRYARPSTPLPEPFLQHGTLLAAGDWCGGHTAGAAVGSGRAAAMALSG